MPGSAFVVAPPRDLPPEFFLHAELESDLINGGRTNEAGVRFTEEQIIAVLCEHEAGAKTTDLAPQARHFRKPRCTTGRPNMAAWRVSDAKRLRSLEEENRKLK